MAGDRSIRLRTWSVGALTAFAAFAAFAAVAQVPAPSAAEERAAAADRRISELSQEVEALKHLVQELQQQVATIAPRPVATAEPAAASVAAVPAAPAVPPTTGSAPEAPAAAAPQVAADLLRGTTINALFDGYYEYNANGPIGRVNYLRAYDVSSNAFSLNQADLVVESAPDPGAGKRTGLRIDLQYGQATATLQGNPANELRPEVYRSIFQAYGTYVVPVGGGLSVDFGKWASSLGIEGNYTKDQLNYSRSLWFDFLPFYHTGLRAKYAVNDRIAVNVWVTNGTQQTEAFNNYKDQLVGLVLTPTPAIAWTLNFYRGQEHPDVVYLSAPGPGQQNLPNQQGTYFLPIANPPDGKLTIGDSYVTWQATPALQFAAEGDYVEERLYSYSSPAHVTGGALYAAYQLAPRFAIAARAEYLADRGGLFSGTTQFLKEGTLTLDYRPVDGFLMRGEFRRDQSNQRYFLSSTLGGLEIAQPTLGLGLVWWIGQKDGAW
jgi:Putative beta-barrel porin-2, OmpL-like. bbp2